MIRPVEFRFLNAECFGTIRAVQPLQHRQLRWTSLESFLPLLAAAIAFFQGCASPADPERMVPTDAVVRKTHSATVDVAVTGGTQTNPLWVSKVSNEDFRKAVETSLLRYGVFSRVIQNQGTDYRLAVELKQLKQPFAGFDMTVTSKVHWQLSNSKTGRIVWQQDIDRRFTATLGDAFYGVHRLELANEGAIRENIKTAVQELGQLSF